MNRFVVAGLCVVAVGVGGCAKRVPQVPPETSLTLGGQRVVYRGWATVDELCAVNAQQFTDEQQALTALLAQWLGQTSATADGAWDDEHLALLEEGHRVLPQPLQLQQASLEKAATAGCGFTGLGPARELNGQALRRLEAAPELIEQVRARLALARWKEARPAAQQRAKDSACTTKLKPPAPILYFAAEDETARLEWLFCDGSKVVASPGNPPAWANDPAAKPTKRPPDPRVWLDVASQYPPGQVSRAPRLPRKKLQVREDGLEPEDRL